MVSCFLQDYPNIVLKLFTAIPSQGTQIIWWNTAIINPIHKKGLKSIVDNYRGISLLSCFGKFFTAILHKRLLEFCLKNKILSKEQMGFIPGNRTSDACIILHSLIKHYCFSNNKYIYGCFVDLSNKYIYMDVLLIYPINIYMDVLLISPINICMVFCWFLQ